MSRNNEQDNLNGGDNAWEDDRPETSGLEGAASQTGSTENGNQREGANTRPVTPPTNEQPEASGRTDDQEGKPCIVIGAKKSGKTALLLAIHRASHLPDDDNLEIAFVAEGATHRLIQQATKIITELQTGPAATDVLYKEELDYPFRIEARVKNRKFWERPIRESIHATVKDVPGGSLFPPTEADAAIPAYQTARQKLVQFAKTAGTLVFCIDATEPHTPVLESQLPQLLYEMSDVKSVREIEQRRSIPLFRTSQPDMWYRDKRCINVDRFLLLLTKVDQLCAGLSSPITYASWIDPVEQARGMLGPSLLNTIRSFLKPGAKFAVGVSSAWGFNEVGGQPFAGPEGLVGQLSNTTPEQTFLRWTPFGIRDAIFFLTTGECRGTVREIKAENLLVRSGLDPHEIPRDDLDQTEQGDEHGS